MKKLKYLMIVAGLLSLSTGTMLAQCTPGDPGSLDYGFTPSYDSLECWTQGEWKQEVLQLKVYETFTVAGIGTVNVDSITILDVLNLPCGISWTTDQGGANSTYATNEVGCIVLAGETADSAGQYRMDILIDAYINGSPGPVQVFLSNGNVKYYTRVQTSGGSCAAVDTNATGLQQDCTSPAWTGIADNQIANLEGVSLTPNPAYNTVTVNVTANEAAEYRVSVIDLGGKVVQSHMLNVENGFNRFSLNVNELPRGAYFVQFTNGKQSTAQKLILAR